MTIKGLMAEYGITDGSKYQDALFDSVNVWSNEVCKGYVIDAMQRAGVDEEQAERVLQALATSFDRLTVTEAEELYANFVEN